MQLLAKFEKILYMGFRATLTFRKFKVALNPNYRIFSNFAKSCTTLNSLKAHLTTIDTYIIIIMFWRDNPGRTCFSKFEA